VRGSTRWDIVLFALAVVLVPPADLIAVEALAFDVSRPLLRALHLVFVAGLAGVVIVQVLERSADLTSTAVLVGLAALLSAAVAFLYWRLPPFRSLLSVLALAPLAFLAYFLFVSPVAELTLAREPDVALANVSARAPVVLVVLDELPDSSLLDEEGEIDAVRYPSFAELAQGSTWFRHASTVSYSTTHAVPAILTGQRATPGPPIFASHPRNLFTLLGADYRMNVVETYTRLCPEVVCKREASPVPEDEPVSLYSDVGLVYLHLLAPPRLEETLPPITGQWMNFGRKEDEAVKLLEEALAEPVGERPKKAKGRYHDVHTRAYQRFLGSIEPSGKPSLNFIQCGFRTRPGGTSRRGANPRSAHRPPPAATAPPTPGRSPPSRSRPTSATSSRSASPTCWSGTCSSACARRAHTTSRSSSSPPTMESASARANRSAARRRRTWRTLRSSRSS
jgi:hypothetical protein